ncbi:hypothetical protein D3C74_137770 [compost metagenome]
MSKQSNNSNIHPSVYIPSIEGSSIYLHNYHNQQLYIKYVGMIPSSLELEALIQNVMVLTEGDKPTTRDIVNVSFTTKVKTVDDKIKKLRAKLNNAIRQRDEYTKQLTNSSNDEKRRQALIKKRDMSIERLKEAISKLEQEHWDESSIKDIQEDLYVNGFYINFYDKNSTSIERIDYIISHRSSAKSRIGKILAIRKELYEKMKLWRRMGLDIDGRNDIDFVSTLAYESLTGSSIVDSIELDPKHIFVIEDFVSRFEHPANLISVNDETGLLVSKPGMGKFANKIWDGQALLDEEYFSVTDKSMMLLRQHWFKACAFRCSVSDFLRKQAEMEGINFDTWKLIDMFGNTVKAKDIRMITTPSALKFLKIAHVVGLDKDMYQYWCKTVREQGSRFGVVKNEKSSKFGYIDGKLVHQMSYQYLNSLPISKEELKQLSEYELKYIDKLKNDIGTFVQYAQDTADITNGNEMLVALYQRNPNFARTEIFKNWKSRLISDYVKRVKRGKLKVAGADYMVLCSNPIEMLYSVVNGFDGREMTLNGKEVYCKAFAWDTRLIGMRSPHTSPSNILSIHNTYIDLINTYMPNLSNNIIVINSIDNPVLDVLSGADMDSDVIWASDNAILSRIAESANETYLVCLGDVGTKDNKYIVCNSDMAEIDSKLKNDYIGRITNISSLLCSHIWDAKARGEDVSDMLDQLSVLSVSQGLAIDYAKRIPNVDIKDILSSAKKVMKVLLDGEKQVPVWWAARNKEALAQYTKELELNKASDPDKELNKASEKVRYSCPMDDLQEIFSGLPNAKRNGKEIPIKDLIVKKKAAKANNGQKHMVQDLLNIAVRKVESSHAQNVDDETKKENYVDRKDILREVKRELGRRKINEDTMYALIQNIICAKIDNHTINHLNILYQSKKDTFLKSWKEK